MAEHLGRETSEPLASPAKPKTPLVPMTVDELTALCFKDEFNLLSERNQQTMGPFFSKGATTEDSGENADTSTEGPTTSDTSPEVSLTSRLEHLQQLSEAANTRVAQEIESRQGRSLQRWESDTKTGLNHRLVAGCVPLLRDGSIMLISSGKLTEWVLPKGGWELDECVEEAAIRECYEEAGVLGTLGPKFEDFLLETKKARKFRLDIEDKVFKNAETPRSESEFYSGWSQLSQLSEEDHLLAEEPGSNTTSEKGSMHAGTPAPPDAIQEGVQVTFNEDALLSGKSLKNSNNMDATASTSSLSSLTHTHVKMAFFPLYVKQIQDTWPESHRLRRSFPIDGKLIPYIHTLNGVLLSSAEPCSP